MSTSRHVTFFHALNSRSVVARVLLEELGADYDVHLLDLQTGTQREPAYLAVNPMGKVPAIRHGDAVVTEQGAVYLLGERFSAADVLWGGALQWTTMFKLVPELPEITAYIARFNARPAVARARGKDAELAGSAG